MGITPITNLTGLLASRPIGSDLEVPPMARVENSARTGDETYSPSGGKSAGGSEDDGSEDDFEDLAGEDEAESTGQSGWKNLTRQISFFA